MRHCFSSAALDRVSSRALILGAIAAIASTQLVALALAAEDHVVVQNGRAFDPKVLDVTVGDVVQFRNNDEFLHQIYVASSDFSFDSAESSPGDTIPLKFTTRGTFEVRCHIHPKMLVTVTVK